MVERFCTKCGSTLSENLAFCKNCGTKIEALQGTHRNHSEPMERATLKSNSRSSKNSKTLQTALMAIVGVAVLLVGGYFIFSMMKGDSPDSAEKASVVKKEKTEETPSSSKKQSSPMDEGAIIDKYIGKLNALNIHTPGTDLSLGEWNISNEDGTIFLSAKKIPSKDLAKIFELYDAGDIDPLKRWAKDVYYLAEDLSKELDADWGIDVGNECVGEYPATLPSADLINLSGSCGYSIPVLTGGSKENLSLIITTPVFMESNSASGTFAGNSTDYMLPDSDIRRLTEDDLFGLNLEQLRLARNEIYARHGFIFNSEELRAYFSQKSWYSPDASYDGVTLTETEKYNVELIQSRENDLK